MIIKGLSNIRSMVIIKYICFRFYLMLLALLILIFSHQTYAQLNDAIRYDDISGDYFIRFRDSLTQQVYNWTYEPGNKVHPFVKVNIEYDRKNDYFIYDYTIQNGTNSRQNLIEFAVKIKDEYERQKLPSKMWESKRYYLRPIISWMHKQTEFNPEKDGIKPGSELNGFSFISKGLPAIIPCYFIGYSKTSGIPKNLPPDIFTYFTDLASFPNNAVKRMTIGPSPNMDNLDEISTIDSLLTYNDQALNLGWITRVRIYNEISNALNDGRRLILQGNREGALNKFNQLLKILKEHKEDCLNSGVCQLFQHHINNLHLQLYTKKQ